MRDIRFTIEGYGEIIRAFLRQGYTTVGFSEFEPRRGALLLRHDIDVSLLHAAWQAETNAQLGVSATFFFLVSTHQYNLASPTGREVLTRVLRAGQRLGLHFDASLYEDRPGELESCAAAEVSVLETIANSRVEAISFHRPVKSLQGLPNRFASLPHAYEPRFFSEIEYCSDSRGQFHHGAPWERAAFLNTDPYQFLTHPMWWMREKEMNGVGALLEFSDQREKALRSDLADNCQPLADYYQQNGVEL